MTNAEWMIKQGYKFKNIYIKQNSTDFCIYEIWIGNMLLIDTYRCTNERTDSEIILKWLDQEHKEPILDDAERRYLKGVIRPFRDRVEFISKVVMDYQGGYTDCYICIRFTDSSKDMSFPVFCETDMYKGMEFGKTYSPKDLGL